MEKLAINKRRISLGVLLGLLIHLLLLSRLKFTAWPEMTLWPYLMLKGWLPYRDIAIAHTPLLFIDLIIVYGLFGVGLWQLKIYTWLLILLTDGLLFWIIKKLWDEKVALLSLAFYIPLQLFYEGNGLWFDLALAPMALIIFYLLKKKNYIWAGISWALAFLIKQTAFWFLIPIALTLLEGKIMKNSRKFVAGFLFFFLPFLAVIWLLGILPEFIYWTYEFGVKILPMATGQISMPTLRQFIVAIFPFSILLFSNQKDVSEITPWVALGIFGAFPRWGLFHFQPALPFLAIAGGLLIKDLRKMKSLMRFVLMGVLILTMALFLRSFSREWGGGDRFFEQEFMKIVSYVKENTQPNDEIYALNTWDSVYALSNTLPAVGPWVPHLSWYMELPEVQEDIVSSLDIVRPKLIIRGEYSESGLGSYKPELVNEFIEENYEIIDKIDNHLVFFPKK
jgi:hypothetical protein